LKRLERFAVDAAVYVNGTATELPAPTSTAEGIVGDGQLDDGVVFNQHLIVRK
jgi:hypothetical protein